MLVVFWNSRSHNKISRKLGLVLKEQIYLFLKKVAQKHTNIIHLFLGNSHSH
ncbi:hypothetical protein BAFK78_857 [Borreliella afzelii K78]|nr:hypothetical protein BAFK78_857 [Borreliella afzelii K78]